MKTFFKVVAILVLGLGVGAVAFWGFTKTQFYTKVQRQEVGVVQEALPILYVIDPDVGPMMKPHTKIHFKTPRFDNTVVTNADGFTGRDYALETRNYRIAILGDSAVEAYSVPDTSRFPHMTEYLIYEKTKGRRKVEVMGFGVSGWGNVQHYGALRKYVLKYKPDEVWIMFLPTNETGDNTPLMNAPPAGPYFIYKSPDSNEIVDIKFGWPDVPQAMEAERKRRYGGYLQDTWGKWNGALLPYFWSPESSVQWDLVMDHTYQTLGLIKKLCDEHHARVVLVYRATGYDQNQGNFDQMKNDAAKFLGRELPMERELGMKRFRKRVEAMGIEFVNTLEMKDSGIQTKADEGESKKHVELANFFADEIIRRLDAKDRAGAAKK